MKKISSVFGLLFLMSFIVTSAPVDWRKISTVKDVCTAFPEKMQYIFQNLNLDYPGLEKTKSAFENGKLEEACELLLVYYHLPESSISIRNDQPEFSNINMGIGDSILHDIFTFQQVAGKVPRLENGHLMWNYNGPEDDIEWAWALNRHYPLASLLPYYYGSGNSLYAKYIDQFIKDWIIESWPYPAVKSQTAMWRGLEVSFRVKVWAQIFYGLMNSGYLSQATQLLILSSLPDHAHYARNFHAQGNWLTMEISGLATVATSWPEFKESDEWLNYSVTTMTESLKGQVYPDGVQTELTSSYHFVALHNFELFSEICKKAGKELPLFYTETLEKMYNYLAKTIRPDGFGLLNNDADLVNNVAKVMQAAKKFKHDDWKYIASNGEEGTEPIDGPSYIFPWAGHLVSRSGFDEQAQWSYFDVGPWGSGHQHKDKLHISITAYGRDFLVDAGRFAYKGEVARKFRSYATNSKGHNLILIDGKGQQPGPKLTDEPLGENQYKITRDFDFAWGSFSQYGDLKDVKHTRSFFYVRDNFWILVDKVKTTEPRKIETLWHWHPDCKVEKLAGGIVSTQNKNANLKIIPVEKTDWDVDLIKGQETPDIQGWYSEEYNVFEPNTTSVYTCQIQSDATFVWVLFPSKGSGSKIKTSIISENKDEIKLKVLNPEKGEWLITVPDTNSENAQMSYRSF